MKLLIIGCSHSVGVWNKLIKNKPHGYNADDGWVFSLAEKYNNYDIDCISHGAGGIFNYMITIGMLNKKIHKYDKIIIQYTEEPRLTIYNVDEKKDLLFYSKVKTKLNNLKRYDLLSYDKNNHQLFCLHNLLLINNELKLNDDYSEDYILKVLSGKYIDTNMINSFKFIIKELFKEKLFTFEWYDIIKKINKLYGEDTYSKIISSVDNAHLDSFGNKIVFELIENDLDTFLK